MSKQSHFFAAIEDLKEALLRVQSKIEVIYVPNKSVNVGTLKPIPSLICQDDFGVNSTGRPGGAGSYFVVVKDMDIPIKRFEMAYGQGTREKFDTSVHKGWIYFEPGGQASMEGNEHRFVVGKFGYTFQEPTADELFKIFKSQFLKGFKKHEHISVIGPHARQFIGKAIFLW